MIQTPDDMANRYFRQAYNSQMSGRLDEAIDLYRRSIDIYPTAEAYTYLGWTYSFKGDLESAISYCKEAIELDPEFGNPYNDIGSYLIRQNKFEEAIPWLERACDAQRYDARHYPFYNLGRIYDRLGEVFEAIKHYREAADVEPNFEAAAQAAERLQAWMN